MRFVRRGARICGRAAPRLRLAARRQSLGGAAIPSATLGGDRASVQIQASFHSSRVFLASSVALLVVLLASLDSGVLEVPVCVFFNSFFVVKDAVALNLKTKSLICGIKCDMLRICSACRTANIGLICPPFFWFQLRLLLTDPFIFSLLPQLTILPCPYWKRMLSGMLIDSWGSKLLCRQL